MYVLIVISYLAGYAHGYHLTYQEFGDMQACENARVMIRQELRSWGEPRDILHTMCVRKVGL